MSRQQVHELFQASNGALPPPTVTWPTPAPIVYGLPLSARSSMPTASVAGTFDYYFRQARSSGRAPSQILAVDVHACRHGRLSHAGHRLHASSMCSKSTPQSSGHIRRISLTARRWAHPVECHGICHRDGSSVPVSGHFHLLAAGRDNPPDGQNQKLTVSFTPFDTYDYASVTAFDHHCHPGTTDADADATAADAADTITDALAHAFADSVTHARVPPPPPPPPPTPPPPPPTPSPTPSPTPGPTPSPTPGRRRRPRRGQHRTHAVADAWTNARADARTDAGTTPGPTPGPWANAWTDAVCRLRGPGSRPRSRRRRHRRRHRSTER